MNPRYTLVCVLYGNPVDDTALLRQALEALDSKYIVNCGAWQVQRDAAITALRERLALSDAAKLAPKPGQLKDRGQI
jgi:hypothetical protein